ncbi:MAG: DNA polymerase III subunit beta [Planctomycetota bacterium]|nr:DNA polymerase III subunit beta [Planctomycetota bacterium]MDI6786928.1 DNA polymerase III subunit beta [Planctomycetota bacterium]
MKVICNKNLLLKAYQLVSPVVPSKSSMPVLQNIKLTADTQFLWVSATDLEIGMEYPIPAEIKEVGSVIISNNRLGGILRETQDEQINIASSGGVAEIRTKTSKYKMVCMDVEDYPDFPAFNEKKSITISAEGLKEMIHKTTFASSQEMTRYALTGLLMEIKKKEIRLVASDGKRLAYIKQRRPEQEIKDDIKAIVSPRALNLLERLLDDDKGQILRIEAEETQVKWFIPLSAKGAPTGDRRVGSAEGTEKQEKDCVQKDSNKGIILFSRLIEGSFPDYETVIPTGNDKKIDIAAGELSSAMRQVSLVTTDKFRATQITLEKDKMTLLTITQDVGEATVEVPIKYSGEPFKITFNPDFFIDVLRVIGDNEINLSFKEKTSPAVIRQGKDYVYIVMPLTIEMQPTEEPKVDK